VTVGDQTLTPDAPNRIAAGADLAFDVTFANQGENEESDVNVRVRIRGETGKPITAQKRVPSTKPGANTEVTVPLGQAPPIGTPVTIEVSVPKVPGEQKTDNNRQTYTAIFTR
jgi:subtilase family serine protease